MLIVKAILFQFKSDSITFTGRLAARTVTFSCAVFQF